MEESGEEEQYVAFTRTPKSSIRANINNDHYNCKMATFIIFFILFLVGVIFGLVILFKPEKKERKKIIVRDNIMTLNYEVNDI